MWFLNGQFPGTIRKLTFQILNGFYVCSNVLIPTKTITTPPLCGTIKLNIQLRQYMVFLNYQFILNSTGARSKTIH